MSLVEHHIRIIPKDRASNVAYSPVRTEPERKRCLSCFWYKAKQGQDISRCRNPKSPYTDKRYPPEMTCDEWKQW